MGEVCSWTKQEIVGRQDAKGNGTPELGERFFLKWRGFDDVGVPQRTALQRVLPWTHLVDVVETVHQTDTCKMARKGAP